MRDRLADLVDRFDGAFARAALSITTESPRLIALALHQVIEKAGDTPAEDLRPGYATSLEYLRRIIDHFLGAGYRFLGIPQLGQGELDQTRGVLLTFDDGYFSSTLVLPLVEEYDIPAAFFVSPWYVSTGECFWWDVLYRNCLAGGRPPAGFRSLEAELQTWAHDRVRAYLIDRWGGRSLQPRGDHDRPMTEDELRELAGHRLVTLGNHTLHHQMLDACGHETAWREIEACSTELQRIGGYVPMALAYPEGRHFGGADELLKQAGIAWAFTLEPNSIASGREGRLSTRYRLGRYPIGAPDDLPGLLARIRLGWGLRPTYLRLRRGLS